MLSIPLLRRLFRLYKSTEQLTLLMGRMDLDGCNEVLQGVEALCPGNPVHDQLRELISRVGVYRPFLPQGIFIDVFDDVEAPVGVPLSDSGEQPTIMGHFGPPLSDEENLHEPGTTVDSEGSCCLGHSVGSW